MSADEIDDEDVTATIDQLKRDLRTVKRLNKKYSARIHKYDEPGTVGRLMWLMMQDPDMRYTKHNKDGTTTSRGDFKELEEIYQAHFGDDERYSDDGCPHCNAIALNTTVAELIACIELDIAAYSRKR